MSSHLIPKIITTFKEGYTFKLFERDLIAGIIVGVVAFPLAIAFAIASGVSPERGLYTAIVAGFIISALGGSRFQIGGPTGAFVVIVFNIVHQYGYEGLVVATLLAGVFLILMGMAGLGSFIQFIPYPVTIGFTAGIAVIIFITQIKDFLGLSAEHLPAKFIPKVLEIAHVLPTINWSACLLGILSIAAIYFWPRVNRKIPGALIAVVLTTAVAHLFHLPVETIGSRFGVISSHLSFRLPNMEGVNIYQMISPALTIALLAGVESLLSAVVADGMKGTRHRSNMEIVAQGVANIASALTGGIPATGAIARTATNIKNGAATPVAGIIHAITLFFIMVFFSRWVSLIPLSALAGILILVAYKMSEWRQFVKMFKSPRGDVLILLITFFLTVLVDLTVAIQTGVVLASLLFMQRISSATKMEYITDSLVEDEDGGKDDSFTKSRYVPEGVEIFEIYGPFFFGAVDKFKTALNEIQVKKPKVLILHLNHVPIIDATGLRALQDVVSKAKQEKIQIILSGVHDQPLKVMIEFGLVVEIGFENVLIDMDKALERSKYFLAAKV